MARASREQSELTARRILDTARRLFAGRGHAAVPLEEVAAQAGVTRGAVYHHFASSRGLLAAVLDEVQREVADEVRRAAEAAEDPWDALEAGCLAFLTASAADGNRRIMLLDAPAVLGWNAWREQDARNSARLLAEALRDLHEAGALAVGSPAAATAMVSGALNEAALWIADHEDPAAALTEAAGVLHRLLRALRRDTTPARQG